jgi:hypothetical protein
LSALPPLVMASSKHGAKCLATPSAPRPDLFRPGPTERQNRPYRSHPGKRAGVPAGFPALALDPRPVAITAAFSRKCMFAGRTGADAGDARFGSLP